MSKVSFRARQIDLNKPLPILRNDSELLSDFAENALVNRGVPQIPSGMEKEEENEHHFVEVIQALQLRSNVDVSIPVPEIIDRSDDYAQFYPNGFVVPKQFIHIRTILLAEQEPVEYDMDTEDEEWLQHSDLNIPPEKFESMIDRLERGCGQKVMNLEEAKYLLQDDPSLVIAVYDYWLNKRVQSRQPLIFPVRQEKRDGGSNTDPYVAFRRRTEKMQTRKNRKNDEQSYEKMLILREQMDPLGEVLSRLVKREILKEAIVQNEFSTFSLRYKLCDWDASNLMEADNIARKIRVAHDIATAVRSSKRSSRKRKISRRLSGVATRQVSSGDPSDVEQEDDPSGPFAFIRLPGCRYLKPRGFHDTADKCTANQHAMMSYHLTTIPFVHHTERHVYTGYIRRRIGRGGRMVYDRVPPPSDGIACFLAAYDKELQCLDPNEFTSSKATIPCSASEFQGRALMPQRDVKLFSNLQASILGAHPSHPSLPWPPESHYKFVSHQFHAQDDLPPCLLSDSGATMMGMVPQKITPYYPNGLRTAALASQSKFTLTSRLSDHHSPTPGFGSVAADKVRQHLVERTCASASQNEGGCPVLPVGSTPSVSTSVIYPSSVAASHAMFNHCTTSSTPYDSVATDRTSDPGGVVHLQRLSAGGNGERLACKEDNCPTCATDSSCKLVTLSSPILPPKSRRLAHDRLKGAVLPMRAVSANHELHANGNPETSLSTAHILAT